MVYSAKSILFCIFAAKLRQKTYGYINHDILLQRIERLRALLNDDNKSIHLTFITSKGIKANMYSGIVQYEITLNDLMKP